MRMGPDGHFRRHVFYPTVTFPIVIFATQYTPSLLNTHTLVIVFRLVSLQLLLGLALTFLSLAL